MITAMPPRRPTMLVVEDEPQVRRMIPRIVSRLGWRTRDAAHAKEALDELEAEPVDLVISDIRLPGGPNGCQLIRQVVQRWPGTRVLLITAYVGFDMVDCVDGMPLLRKPFTFEELETKIAQVMAAPPWSPEAR
jgi:CheY-like chemotaxis protein